MLLGCEFTGGKYAHGPNQGIDWQYLGSYEPERYLICINNAAKYGVGLGDVDNGVKSTVHHDTKFQKNGKTSKIRRGS